MVGSKVTNVPQGRARLFISERTVAIHTESLVIAGYGLVTLMFLMAILAREVFKGSRCKPNRIGVVFNSLMARGAR